MTRTTGILSDASIERLHADASIIADKPFDSDQVQPASLDLRLGKKAYRVRASFLPGRGKSVSQKLDRFKLHELDLTDGAILETGCVYLVPLIESLDLPADIEASANPKSSTGRDLVLDPDEFYILVSNEAVHVPPLYAAEMVPYDTMVGEFRVHYAGFFDPGFGHIHAGGAGSRGVLEVRSHDVPFILEHDQLVGSLVYEHMLDRPEQLYGTDLGSNYQAQGLKLSKHFKA